MPALTDHSQKVPGLKIDYTDEQVALIHRFLASCLTKAEVALEAETPTNKSLLSHPLVAGRMAYWRNVASGLRWAGYLATRKQWHLLDPDDSHLTKLVEQWMQLPLE